MFSDVYAKIARYKRKKWIQLGLCEITVSEISLDIDEAPHVPPAKNVDEEML